MYLEFKNLHRRFHISSYTVIKIVKTVSNALQTCMIDTDVIVGRTFEKLGSNEK